MAVISIQDAETYFDIDEFNDLYAKTKPTLFIKMSDIFSIHQLVSSEINHMCPNADDILKEIVRGLGNVKNNENELMSVNSSEISLTLNPKLAQIDGKIHTPCPRCERLIQIPPQTQRQMSKLCSWKQSDAFSTSFVCRRVIT